LRRSARVRRVQGDARVGGYGSPYPPLHNAAGMLLRQLPLPLNQRADPVSHGLHEGHLRHTCKYRRHIARAAEHLHTSAFSSAMTTHEMWKAQARSNRAHERHEKTQGPMALYSPSRSRFEMSNTPPSSCSHPAHRVHIKRTPATHTTHTYLLAAHTQKRKLWRRKTHGRCRKWEHDMLARPHTHTMHVTVCAHAPDQMPCGTWGGGRSTPSRHRQAAREHVNTPLDHRRPRTLECSPCTPRGCSRSWSHSSRSSPVAASRGRRTCTLARSPVPQLLGQLPRNPSTGSCMNSWPPDDRCCGEGRGRGHARPTTDERCCAVCGAAGGTRGCGRGQVASGKCAAQEGDGGCGVSAISNTFGVGDAGVGGREWRVEGGDTREGSEASRVGHHGSDRAGSEPARVGQWRAAEGSGASRVGQWGGGSSGKRSNTGWALGPSSGKRSVTGRAVEGSRGKRTITGWAVGGGDSSGKRSSTGRAAGGSRGKHITRQETTPHRQDSRHAVGQAGKHRRDVPVALHADDAQVVLFVYPHHKRPVCAEVHAAALCTGHK
jgi:hypothetical protein